MKNSDRRRDILKEKRISERETRQKSEETDDKTNAMVCRAVWITDMSCKKRIYKKTGGLKCEYAEEWKKISCTQHNNKLKSAGNDWRRKSPGTGRHEQRDEGNGIKKETKEMERTWAVIFSSIFTLFHVMH